MPNVNGGFYFLTTLIPVLDEPCRDHRGIITEPVNLLRRSLAFLPAAHQSQASLSNSFSSPFARNTRNHFVRFAIIDALAFNGRLPQDAIVQALKGDPLADPKPVDRLTRPFLLFAADFDAVDDSEFNLESWLDELWRTMPMELNDVFRHCVGWSEVASAADFCRWIRANQVETTMPFNDYWIDKPPLKTLPIGLYAGLGALTLLGTLGLTLLVTGGFAGRPWWVWLIGIGLGGFAAVKLLLKLVRDFAAPPWPAPPGSDLPHILKGLYLQREFVDFVGEVQGAGADELYARFGDFIALHHPGSTGAPTQPPGVINMAGLDRAMMESVEDEIDWRAGYGRPSAFAPAPEAAPAPQPAPAK